MKREKVIAAVGLILGLVCIVSIPSPSSNEYGLAGVLVVPMLILVSTISALSFFVLFITYIFLYVSKLKNKRTLVNHLFLVVMFIISCLICVHFFIFFYKTSQENLNEDKGWASVIGSPYSGNETPEIFAQKVFLGRLRSEVIFGFNDPYFDKKIRFKNINHIEGSSYYYNHFNEISCGESFKYHVSPKGDVASILLKRCDQSGKYFCLGFGIDKDNNNKEFFSSNEETSELDSNDQNYFCGVKIVAKACPYINPTGEYKKELDKMESHDVKVVEREQKKMINLFSDRYTKKNKYFSQSERTFLFDRHSLYQINDLSDDLLCPLSEAAKNKFKLPLACYNGNSVVLTSSDGKSLNFIKENCLRSGNFDNQSRIPWTKKEIDIFSSASSSHKKWLCKFVSIGKDGDLMEGSIQELDYGTDTTKYPTCGDFKF